MWYQGFCNYTYPNPNQTQLSCVSILVHAGRRRARRQSGTWTPWACCIVWTSSWPTTASSLPTAATLLAVPRTSWGREARCVGLTQVRTADHPRSSCSHTQFMFINNVWTVTQSCRLSCCSGAFGTLGVGGGFALGAKLCRPESEVSCEVITSLTHQSYNRNIWFYMNYVKCC